MLLSVKERVFIVGPALDLTYDIQRFTVINLCKVLNAKMLPETADEQIPKSVLNPCNRKRNSA